MKLPFMLIIPPCFLQFHYDLYTQDLYQTYFVCKSLDRPVYTNLSHKARLTKHFIQCINLPHHSLKESGTCWFDKYYPTYTSELIMDSAPFDRGQLFKETETILECSKTLATNSSIETGLHKFEKGEANATQRF